MKRSSSKLIAKAGSVRNINKVGFKFRFKLEIESLDKLISANEVVVAWQRGPKVLCTPPVAVDKNRVANFNNQSLSQDITLFKKKKADAAEFQDKVFKLIARAGSETGKIIARIEINFADYVAIPSFSKRVSAAMSNGGRLIMRVSSDFLGEAKTRKGSRGTNSMGSSAFDNDSDAGSMLDGDESANDQLNSLNDLEIGDGDSSFPSATPAPPPAPPVAPPSYTPSNYNAPANSAPSHSANSINSNPYGSSGALQQASRRPSATRRPSGSSADEHSSGSLGRAAAPRRQANSPRGPSEDMYGGISGGGGSLRGASPNMRVRPPAHRIDSDLGVTSGGGGAGAPSKVEFERMSKEVRSLRRANDDLMMRNNDLERRLDNMVGMDGDGDQLATEVKRLRRLNEELESQLKREPVYADVVRDLREAKMALAILTLEKDELMQEIRRLRR